MSDAPAPRAAGCLISLAVLVGAGLGTYLGQPSIGVLAGVALGVLVAVLLWLADRRRR